MMVTMIKNYYLENMYQPEFKSGAIECNRTFYEVSNISNTRKKNKLGNFCFFCFITPWIEKYTINFFAQ